MADPLSILYIEDEETLAHLVQRRISKLDYDIHIALDGKTALSLLAEKEFDLLIVDYQLPDMTGIDLLRTYKGNSDNLPAIMVSGQEDVRIAVQAFNIGCMDYLVKDGLTYLELLPLQIKSVCERIILQQQKQQAEQTIEYQANFDSLTDLPNRLLLEERLNASLEIADKENNKTALLFIDLDRFKWVNDTLGHRAGDLLLQFVAQRLKSVIRETDTVARLGGDEFTVVLNGISDHGDAKHIAQKIISVFVDPFVIDEHEVEISASVGITIYPDDAQDQDALFKCADTAMYVAKDAGRAQFAFFTSEMQAHAHNRMVLLKQLQDAIKQEAFVMHYQPIFDLQTKNLVGAEALIRWPQANGQYIAPNDFLPLAEETGLIVPLGEWTVLSVMKQLKIWQDKGYNTVYVSVNKSSKQFYDDECASGLADLANEMDLDLSQFSIEMTESVLMERQEMFSSLIQAYHALGIRIALDDFGTGFSSLSYLHKFDFDVIKIDRSFIAEMTSSKDSATLVDTIITMGHNLGLKVLAEGVETQAQEDFLKDKGCDLIQGFLYSPAVDPLVFEDEFLR